MKTSRPPLTEQPPTEKDRTKPIDRRLFGITEGARRFLWVAVGLGFLSAVAVIAGAALLANIVNAIFLDGAAPEELAGALIALLLIYVARGALDWGRSITAHRAAADAKRTLRERTMRAVLAETARGRPAGSAALALTATTGIDALDAYFSRYLPQLILGALVPLVAIIWISAVDPLTVVIIVVTVPLIPLFMWLIGNYADRDTRSRWRTLRRLGDSLVETLRGVLTLEVYRVSAERLDRVRRLSDEYRKETMATLRIAFLSAFVLELVATISTAVVAVAVGLRVVHGNLDFEPAFAILILAPEIYAPLRKAGSEFHAAMDGMEAARSVFAVLEVSPPDDGTADPVVMPRSVEGAPFVEFSAVSYRYPGSLDGGNGIVLDGIDLHIERGEHLAIVGPSGAGKSTLLRLILGLDHPAGGEVVIEGVPLARADAREWRSRIGWVRQEPFLIAGTIMDNVRLGAPRSEAEDVVAALELVGATDLIPRLADVVGERGVGLSHGQRRMVTLSRSLLRDPDLLLLDEPTAGVDTDTQSLIAESFERISAGRTVVTVAHQRIFVDLADRILSLDNGQIVTHDRGDLR